MPYTEFHYTPTGTGVISGKEVLEQTEDAINDLGTQISGDVQTAIDTANNALNTANTANTNAQNAVNVANAANTTATNAQNTANAAQTTATNAQNAATAAQNDVDALENVVTGIEGRLTTTEGNVTNLTTRMGTAEGNITTLQNDVVTAQGTATSAQNTATLAREQAYVTRYTATSVSDNSTVAYSDLNNTDNIKIGDFILDVNGKLFAITAVDTVNQTVSVTTPLTQLAVDANVMHLTGDESSTGKKIFGDMATFRGSYLGSEPSTSFRTCAEFLGRFDTKDQSGIFLSKFRSNAAQGAMSGSDVSFITMDVLENGERTNAILRFNLSAWSGNTPGIFSLYPKASMTSNLGVTTNKWKRINGLNPGSLSLPDFSNAIDISGYITDLTGASNINKYTPTVDGWVSIGLSNADFIEIYIPSSLIGGTFTKSTINSYAQAFMPVIANKEVRIALKGSSIDWAKFYPCQGNV